VFLRLLARRADGPDADGWFATGDVAYLDEDGDLHLVDRRRELVLVSGFNVYPREVEEVLSRHPDIAEAAVLGILHPYTGESVKALVVLRAAPGCPPTTSSPRRRRWPASSARRRWSSSSSCRYAAPARSARASCARRGAGAARVPCACAALRRAGAPPYVAGHLRDPAGAAHVRAGRAGGRAGRGAGRVRARGARRRRRRGRPRAAGPTTCPVVLLDGVEHARWYVDEAALRRPCGARPAFG
jgi:hypothetical protein